ncbi:hypothetical protein, partial [Nostoc sp. LPT]|uniref:hypothetical protein n=2 Tax=Nostoc TaxID=1177 RepID=UPI0026010950
KSLHSTISHASASLSPLQELVLVAGDETQQSSEKVASKFLKQPTLKLFFKQNLRSFGTILYDGQISLSIP